MHRTIEADFLPPARDFTHSAKFVTRNRVVYHWFDAYDLEEERLQETQQQRKEIV